MRNQNGAVKRLSLSLKGVSIQDLLPNGGSEGPCLNEIPCHKERKKKKALSLSLSPPPPLPPHTYIYTFPLYLNIFFPCL